MNPEKYKIIVNEPWDYNGPHGPNLICGIIIKDLLPNGLIFLSDNELEFDGDKGTCLYLKPRHENLVSKGSYSGIVNAGLLSGNPDEPLELLEKRSKYVLIGMLEKLS